MGIPQIARFAPLPGGILLENIFGHEGLVLDDERNTHEIRKKPLAHQTGLEIIHKDQC